MTTMLVLSLDADVAGHLAVARRRHRSALRKNDLAEPPEIAELEAAALQAVNNSQQASASVTVDTVGDAGARDYLTRSDVQHLTGASLSTIDRWVSSGNLPSSRHGRVRRIARADLDRFLRTAA
jgi:excisionase family DNA binding protein